MKLAENSFVKGLISVLFVFLFSVSCSDYPEQQLKKLAYVYVDLEIAKELAPNSDSLKTLKLKVFEKYSMSESEFDSMFSEIPKEKDVWNKFFDYASAYVDSLRKAEMEAKRKVKERD